MPYVAAGETAPAQTPWEPWIETPTANQPVMLGVKAKIDTTAAPVLPPPCYQAELRGPRYSTARSATPTRRSCSTGA